MEQEEEKITISKEEYSIMDFAWRFCSWGYADIKAALNVWQNAGLGRDELVEELEEWMNSTGMTDLTKIDVCYVAYDGVLQRVRNLICEATEFDLQNDAGFEAYGNYMCSSFEQSEDDRAKLLDVLKKMPSDKREELLQQEIVKFYLEEIELWADVVKLEEEKQQNITK